MSKRRDWVAREVSVFNTMKKEFLERFFERMGLRPIDNGVKSPEGQYTRFIYHCPVSRTGEFSDASRDCGAFATGCVKAIPD